MKTGILYIDDEPGNLISFKATFKNEYTIFTSTSAVEGNILLEQYQKEIHLIIADQKMPEMTGIEFLSSIINKYPDLIRILLSDHSDIQSVIDAINKGHVYHYLTKPWNEKELKIIIDKAYEIFKQREENKKLIGELSAANQQLEFLLRQELLF